MTEFASEGKIRYLWLIYLLFFLMGPVLWGTTEGIGRSLVGVAVFLGIYLLAGRLQGWVLLAPIAGMVLLGLVFVERNPGASTFFVFAAAEAARLGTARRTWAVLCALLAVIAVLAWQVQPHPFFWLPAAALVVVVGSANLHERQMRAARRQLALSQEEVARMARIAERERIARDLHDLLGHTLSVVVLKSELAARLAERDPVRAVQEIREVEGIARQALEEVRSAVSGYRAETLRSEIENARQALAAAGVELEVAVDELPLAPLHEGVLALALREAVTNVIRHAGARHCRVVLCRQGEEIRLEVADDGRGIRAPEGLGLAGMRERVASLGGAVERLAGAGTCLAVRLPLAAGAGA